VARELRYRQLQRFRAAARDSGTPDRFSAALVDYCDYRLAQTWGYDGMDAVRRRPPSVIGSVFDGRGWIALLPLELFSLKYVFERSTGRTLSLDADHPLLRSAFVRIPALAHLHEEPEVRRVASFGRQIFGEDWKPLRS
jgi:hypothetical protein